MHYDEYEAIVSDDEKNWDKINAKITADTYGAEMVFESRTGRYIKVSVAESHLYDMWDISNFCVYHE